LAEDQDSKTTEELSEVDPENLRVKYNTLAANCNAVVSFRFTVISFFLAAVAIILGGTANLSFGKYLLLIIIVISLWTIELRNRTIKNELDAWSKQIEITWHYERDKKLDYIQWPTKLFGIITIPPWAADFIFTHSNAIDLLFLAVLIYASYYAIRILFHI
jgi:hypothetical protein